jgi:hypothetical protein
MQAAPLIAPPDEHREPRMRASLDARTSCNSAGYQHVVDQTGDEQGSRSPQATPLARHQICV